MVWGHWRGSWPSCSVEYLATTHSVVRLAFPLHTLGWQKYCLIPRVWYHRLVRRGPLFHLLVISYFGLLLRILILYTVKHLTFLTKKKNNNNNNNFKMKERNLLQIVRNSLYFHPKTITAINGSWVKVGLLHSARTECSMHGEQTKVIFKFLLSVCPSCVRIVRYHTANGPDRLRDQVEWGVLTLHIIKPMFDIIGYTFGS